MGLVEKAHETLILEEFRRSLMLCYRIIEDMTI